MAQFNEEKLPLFLSVVRKYMQLRGGMTQKDLAEATDIGVSTMSRFLNQKTHELNSQMIAKIVARLQIPLHEMIDFVEEEFAEQFIRLVKFYKEETALNAPLFEQKGEGQEKVTLTEAASRSIAEESDIIEGLGTAGTAKKSTQATINIGGKKRVIHFESESEGQDKSEGQGRRKSDLSIREKMETLTARQKGFLHDFLSLDMDGKDLVVDIGKNIINYLRQKGVDF